MISSKQGTHHTRQISHLPRLESATSKYQPIPITQQNPNKQNMDTTNYHDQPNQIYEKSMRKVKMIKNVPMIDISKQSDSFYEFNTKLAANSEELKSMTNTERIPFWNSQQIQQRGGQQTKRILFRKNTKQNQQSRAIAIFQSVGRHDLIHIYKTMKNLQQISNSTNELDNQLINQYINSIDSAISQNFAHPSNQKSTEVQAQLSTKQQQEQVQSVESSTLQKYSNKLMEIVEAVYRLKNTIEQLEEDSSIRKNSADSSLTNGQINRSIKNDNISKWKVELEYLLSSIKGKHVLSSLHHVREQQHTLITHQKDQALKNTDKNIPHYTNSNSLYIKQESVMIKPFQIDSQLHRQCDCSEISSRSSGHMYTVPESSTITHHKIQLELTKITDMYNIFKQVYRFMLELLYAHLSQDRIPITQKRQKLINNADQIYNNYITLKITNSANHTDKIHQLHSFMQEAVKGLKQLRKQCKKQLIF